MSDYTTADIESTELDKRDVRALTEYMTTLETAPDVYSVTTQSGSEYTVDAREGRCTCPDATHRDVRCKHQRRLAFARGERDIPAFVETDAVDEQLGIHVDGTPRVAATDGGIIEASDDGEILDESDDGRPDDCECESFHGNVDIPCWPCYREGFNQPGTDE